MFREMRRSQQQLSEAETLEILERGTTAVLALSGDDGYPYSVPVNYVYADGKIYFHGAKAGHKFDALRRESRLSLCVIDRDEVVPEKLTDYYRSAIVFGRAEILEQEEEILHAARVLGLRFWDNEAGVEKEIQGAFDRLCCVAVTIDYLSGKTCIELVPSKKR